MKVLAITVCAILLATSAFANISREAQFKHFMKTYNRQYESDHEYALREKIFNSNVDMIELHNARGRSSYTLAVNEFADMSWEEFQKIYLPKDPQHCSATENGNLDTTVRNDPPAAFDWRTHNVLQPVKNQGHCGSCWTFSTTGCLEAVHAIKHGKHVGLSEQQLVDCAQAYDNHGCEGGLPSHAYEYIMAVGGLETEAAYPYTGTDDKCVFNGENIGATVFDVVNITQGHEEDIVHAVGNYNPVSVAFEVVDDFRFYSGGVYSSDKCGSGPQDVNHAVVAVGYNVTDSGRPFWTIRNSWGADWGLSGYFEMERGKNMCGVATCASFPVV